MSRPRKADVQPEADSPGSRIISLLEERGWTQATLAEVMGRPLPSVNEIIRGDKAVTPATARELARAFGRDAYPPEDWLALEAKYRLARAREEGRASELAEIEARAELYAKAPVPELISRGWIEKGPIAAMKSAVDELLAGEAAASFRQSENRGPEQSSTAVWIGRVRQLARACDVPPFDLLVLQEVVEEVLDCCSSASDFKTVPDILREAGVRLVILGHLPKTFLDGACIELDDRPVIALTLRHDRLDGAWFTLLHELGHACLEHKGTRVDICMDAPQPEREAAEAEADEFARTRLIPEQEYESFVRETFPYFSAKKITSFAERIGRHPGIVLGRLQRDRYVGYQNLRHFLPKLSPELGLDEGSKKQGVVL